MKAIPVSDWNKLVDKKIQLEKENKELIEVANEMKKDKIQWNTGDAWCCETHPSVPFPHDKCPGPGMPDHQGRATIKHLRKTLNNVAEWFKTYQPDVDTLEIVKGL